MRSPGTGIKGGGAGKKVWWAVPEDGVTWPGEHDDGGGEYCDGMVVMMTVVLMTVPIINLMLSSDQYGGSDYCDGGDDNGDDDNGGDNSPRHQLDFIFWPVWWMA